MSSEVSDLYEFGHYTLNVETLTLWRDEALVSLPPKAFELLRLLLERHGEIVSKQQIFDHVWADTFVEDGVLTQNVYILRNILGTDENGKQFIETIPRRGYRFAASVAVSEKNLPIPLLVDSNGNSGLLVGQKTGEEIIKNDAPANLASTNNERISTHPLRIAVFVFAAVLIAAILGSLSWINQPGDDIKSIAVLPFTHVGGGEPDASLEFGLTDTLITRLSQIRRIVVRPTGSVSKYAGRDDTANIGRELNVDAVLEGRIQRQGERLRINVQVIRTSDGTSVWAKKFDSALTDVFAIQDSISTSVAEAIVSKLEGTERELVSKRPTENPEAYRLYATGRYFWNKRVEDSRRKAIELFNQAIELDPNFALAHVGLADCYILGGYGSGTSIGETMSRARKAASRALEIDPTLAEAHASLALINLTYDWDFESAEKGFKQAIELNPNFAGAHHWFSDYLVVKGRFDEALAELAKAKDLDPTSIAIQRDQGRIYYFRREPDKAIEHLRRTLEMDANFFPAVLSLANAYLQKGNYGEAAVELERANLITRVSSLTRSYLVYAYAKDGRRDDAARLLDEMENANSQSPARSYDRAIAHIGLGNYEMAIDLLDKACEERSYRLIYINVDPIFDDLRNMEQFAKLPCLKLLK
jgi:DNA-binding winged helix-turn-helix (wHTH) protein/TolB-like protein/Flp pilus assembly protein TadD